MNSYQEGKIKKDVTHLLKMTAWKMFGEGVKPLFSISSGQYEPVNKAAKIFNAIALSSTLRFIPESANITQERIIELALTARQNAIKSMDLTTK